MKNAIIFDLDGTLWDSSEEIIFAWNHILNKYTDGKIQIDIKFMQSLMGKTMKEIKCLIFKDYPQLNADLIYDECMKYENEYLRKNGAKLYPSLKETLSVLANNYALSIVSNCQCGYIEAFLEYYKLNHLFADTECYGNTLKEKSENIKAVINRNNYQEYYYVGDTLGDYNSATEANVPFIHAKYGFGNVPQAKYSISEISELIPLMEKLK